jgi:hypothetical protein
MELLILLALLLLLVLGIYFLVRYKKTKKKLYLILGLIFTLFVVGVFALIVWAFVVDQSTMTYMPMPE